MDSKLTITITSKTSKPIRINKGSEAISSEENQDKPQNNKAEVSELIQSESKTIPLVDFIYNELLKQLHKKHRKNHFVNLFQLQTAYDNIEEHISEICRSTISLSDNTIYYFGWKQLYNRFIFFDIDQKERELPIIDSIKPNNRFYHLEDLIFLLKSADTEFSMTAFAFILFSVTKSLYKTPSNNSIKDINLSVFSNSQISPCINNSMINSFLQNLVKTIVDDCISLNYNTGQIQNDVIKEHNIHKAKCDHHYFTLNEYEYDKKGYDCAESKISSTNYTYSFADYPIVINNENHSKKRPPRLISLISASQIYIDYTDYSSPQKYILVYPQKVANNIPKPLKTHYLDYLETVLSDKADNKFVSKNKANDLEKEIDKILNCKGKGINIAEFSKKDLKKLSNCIFRKYFHRNQRVTYFDDLYRSAQNKLSFPDSNPELVKIYSYLLASLMSFKEYVDELPILSPYYDDSSTDTSSDSYLNMHKFGLESDYNSIFHDRSDQDDYEEYTSDPIITDITSYKEEFYALFDQTVEIFKRRCAVNGAADHTMSYEDKLVLYFEQFITELQSENSDLIIKPAKEKQGLIFLDFYRYFDRYELFLAKQNFDYTISKQKFNRLLYDNKILKPRYNGNGKTPPKLDYIMKSDQKEYTVLAIKLEVLKSKCAELSK